MILTIKELKQLVDKKVVINPKREVLIDIISIGLHLNDRFPTYEEYPSEPFVPPKSLKTKTESAGKSGFVLSPMDKILSCSEEIIHMPLNYMGFIQTKGSLARGFLTVHMNDSQIDPGYRGHITLELYNFSDFYYKLVPGMPIAQLFFIQLASKIDQGYNGRYQDSDMPTGMRKLKSID